MSQLLNKSASNYKAVALKYQAKDNKKLEKELDSLIVASSKLGEKNSKCIPARLRNVQEKMESIADFFDGIYSDESRP